MQRILFILILVMFLPACQSRQREEQLKQREAALKQREQELLVKEKTLALKQEEIQQIMHKLDSTKAMDTARVYDSLITGVWNVSMNCIEANCQGSVIGDSKTEQWDIFYENNNVICKAMSRNKIARIYSGLYNGSTIELSGVSNATDSVSVNTKITVWLRMTADNQMEGQREIQREGECRVVYALALTR